MSTLKNCFQNRTIGFLAFFLSLSLSLSLLGGCPKTPPKHPEKEKGKTTPKKPLHFEPTWDLAVFKVNGIQVIHKMTPEKAVVSLRVYFDGGCMNLTEKTAGVERLLLSTIELGGSKSYPMDTLSDTLDLTGIQLNAASGKDYSVMAIKTIKPHFEKAWKILVDLLLNPNLDGIAFKVQKSRQLKAIRTRFDSPDSQISVESELFFFAGHPYSRLQLGTEKGVKGFGPSDLKAHHAKLLDPKKMVLVAVGNLDRDTLKKKIRQAFGSLKASSKPTNTGATSQKTIPKISAKKGNRVKYVPRSLPTNYVLGYFTAPAPGQRDYAAARIATAFLSDELFEELRTKRRLVYAASSGLSVLRSNIGYIYLSTKKPNAAVKAALEKIQAMSQDGISQKELDEMRAVFVTKHLLKLQTQSAQATLLARSYLTAGDPVWAERSLAEMRAVTTEEVRRALKKYAKNIQFVLVGPSTIDSASFHSGEPVTTPKSSDTP